MPCGVCRPSKAGSNRRHLSHKCNPPRRCQSADSSSSIDDLLPTVAYRVATRGKRQSSSHRAYKCPRMICTFPSSYRTARDNPPCSTSKRCCSRPACLEDDISQQSDASTQTLSDAWSQSQSTSDSQLTSESSAETDGVTYKADQRRPAKRESVKEPTLMQQLKQLIQKALKLEDEPRAERKDQIRKVYLEEDPSEHSEEDGLKQVKSGPRRKPKPEPLGQTVKYAKSYPQFDETVTARPSSDEEGTANAGTRLLKEYHKVDGIYPPLLHQENRQETPTLSPQAMQAPGVLLPQYPPTTTFNALDKGNVVVDVVFSPASPQTKSGPERVIASPSTDSSPSVDPERSGGYGRSVKGCRCAGHHPRQIRKRTTKAKILNRKPSKVSSNSEASAGSVNSAQADRSFNSPGKRRPEGRSASKRSQLSKIRNTKPSKSTISSDKQQSSSSNPSVSVTISVKSGPTENERNDAELATTESHSNYHNSYAICMTYRARDILRSISCQQNITSLHP